MLDIMVPMPPLQRFFHNHLRPYLLGGLGGALLFTVGNSLQGMILLALNLMFDVQFKMGGSSSATLQSPLQKLVPLLPSMKSIQSNIFLIPCLIAAMFFLRGMLLYLGSLMVARSGMKAVRDLRERLFERVLIQDPAYFQQHPVGELMNRVLGDVQAVQQLASSQVAEILKQISMALVMLVLILNRDWRLALSLLLLFQQLVVAVQADI